MIAFALGGLPLLAWLYLLFGRGMFWLGAERDEFTPQSRPIETWPSVVAVVPARDEADVIGRSIASLLGQTYPGPFRIILVDDQSGDGTADIARVSAGATGKLTVIAGADLPAGWTGKVWALDQGIAHAVATGAADYLLLTDADIAHEADNIRRLVERAEAGRYALVSLMAKLRCETRAERLLIPAFVFFFQMLYPFSRVNRSAARMAAGAGGCMLVRRTALDAVGGIAKIRREIIDDCALARLLKTQGPIWLGLTERARSLRSYGNIGEVGRMVARTAFTQLRHSWALLAGVVIAMLLIFAAPVFAGLFGSGMLRLAGLAAWVAMTLAFQPMLGFYRLTPIWGVALPVVACFYIAFTVKSALDYQGGRGGMWKGRAQAMS